MQPELTIAIPTFNRAAKLKAQLERLLPQLGDKAICRVFDNASSDNTCQIVESYRTQGVSYCGAAHNCGASWNFSRCFEQCETPWLWVLSDDDAISPDAVSVILDIIRTNPCDVVQMSSPLFQHKKDKSVSSVKELLDCMTLAPLVWISAGVYNMFSCRPLMHKFMSAISTWAPHTVMIFSMLESGNRKVFLSSACLLVEPPPVPHWSTLDFVSRFSQVPEYLITPSNQKIVAERFWCENVHWALLTGLREINNLDQLRKWKRLQKQVPRNLKAYHARSPWWYMTCNWFRRGQRKQSLGMFQNALTQTFFGYCPEIFFCHFMKAPLWPKGVRDILSERKNHFAPTKY